MGPPGDDDEDYALDVWAGVLPMRTVFGELDADPLLKDGMAVPGYVTAYKASKHYTKKVSSVERLMRPFLCSDKHRN